MADWKRMVGMMERPLDAQSSDLLWDFLKLSVETMVQRKVAAMAWSKVLPWLVP